MESLALKSLHRNHETPRHDDVVVDRNDTSLVRFYNSYDLSDCTLEIIEENENDDNDDDDGDDDGEDDEIEEKEGDRNTDNPLSTRRRFNVVSTSGDVETTLKRRHALTGNNSDKDIDIELAVKSERPTILRNTVKHEVMDRNANKIEKRSYYESDHSDVLSKRRKLDRLMSSTTKKDETANGKRILFIHSLLFCSNSEYFQKILMSGSRQRNVKIRLKQGETEHFTRLIKLFYDERLIENLSVKDTAQVLKFAKKFKCVNITSKLLRHISSFRISNVEVLNQSVKVCNEIIALDDSNMVDIISRLKMSCKQYLKSYFCPVEKVFGPLLYDFVKLSFESIYFFLDNIDSGIAVSENTVVGLVFYWLEYNSIINSSRDPELSMKLFKRCRFEHVNISFIMDVLCLPQPWLAQSYQEFYMHLLEYHACTDKLSFFPDFPKRTLRCRNFAYDHDIFLYFAPQKTGETDADVYLETAEHNVVFVRGYQLHISAGAFHTDKNRELRIKVSVENVNRMPHSNLYFSMLYSISSPSVSENFSPWNQTTFLIDNYNKSSWNVISLIAKHSLINQTGFYLKFYLE